MTSVEVPELLTDAVMHYTPNDEVAHALSRKIVVPIVGPTAIGKSTLMEKVCKLEPADFHRVQSFTTRVQRPGEPDDAYRWLPHTPDTLAMLAGKAAAGSLVQITQHPETGHFYGSESQDYPASYNILDTLSGAVDEIRRIPFGHCITIALATEPENWQKWFMKRFRTNPSLTDAIQRLDEADKSITWSRNDVDTLWVQNYPSNQYLGARKIIDAARGDIGSDKEAKLLAVRMQNIAIPKLRELIMKAGV